MRGIGRLFVGLALLLGWAGQSQAAITISSTSPPPFEFVQGLAGSPWVSLNATGGTAAPLQSVCYTWTVTGFNIPGLVAIPGSPCAGGILVSGTPTTLGNYSFSVSVTDGQGGSASQQFAVTVVPPLAIVTQTLPDILSGVPYSAQVVVQGGLKPYQQFQCNVGHFSLSCSQGLVTGTITSSSDQTLACGVLVRVTDRILTQVQKCFDLHIKAAQPPSSVLRITTNALPAATIGQPYMFQATAINVTGTPKWSAIGLPAGLMISLSGLIAGTPTGPAGTAMVKLGVGDNTALTDSVTIAMAVQAANTPPPPNPPPTNPPGDPTPGDPNQKVTLTTPPQLDPLVLGKFITTRFSATNGVPPYKFTTAILTLPPGMTLNMDGAYIGAPTKTGDFTFQVTVTDSGGGSDTRTYTQTVFGAPRITNTFPTGEVGKDYSVQLNIDGGSQPYRIKILNLPPWLMYAAGTQILTGKPTAAGTTQLTIEITDANDTKVTETVSIAVEPPPAPLKITSTSPLPVLTVGVTNMFDFTAQGGKTPYAWSIVGNPVVGMTLNPATGKFSGVPLLPIKQTINVKVTGADGQTDQKAFEVEAKVVAPDLLSAAPREFNITLPPISGVPTTTFGKITNATGAEKVTVTGANGAPVAVQASILPDGALVVTANTPSNAPASFQNNITVMGTNGQTVVVPVTMTVAKPTQKQFLQLNGRPVSELPGLIFNFTAGKEEDFTYLIVVNSRNFEFNMAGGDTGQLLRSYGNSNGSDGISAISFSTWRNAKPGVYTFQGTLKADGIPEFTIPVTFVVGEGSPPSATVADATVKLGATPGQDSISITICASSGTTIETDPTIIPRPTTSPFCKFIERPAANPPSEIRIRTIDSELGLEKVVSVQIPSESPELLCDSESQLVIPDNPPKARCVNRSERLVRLITAPSKKKSRSHPEQTLSIFSVAAISLPAKRTPYN